MDHYFWLLTFHSKNPHCSYSNILGYKPVQTGRRPPLPVSTASSSKETVVFINTGTKT